MSEGIPLVQSGGPPPLPRQDQMQDQADNLCKDQVQDQWTPLPLQRDTCENITVPILARG